MLIGEIIRVALGALRANKLRSLLTMLGIVSGVAAVIAVVALGTGAQTAVKDRISSLGTTLLTVMPGQQRGMGITFDQSMKLTMDDAKALDDQSRAPSLTAVQPEMNSRLQVQYQSLNTNTSIVGTTANYLEVRKYELAADLKGSGKFQAVMGFDKAPGTGQKYRYRVDVEEGLGLDAELFAEAVQKTLNDDRSWAHNGGRTFERISSGEPDRPRSSASKSQ